MNGAASLDTIAATLRVVQAEQRVMQDEIALIREGMADLVTLGEGAELLRLLTDRIAGFETLMQMRFDRLFAVLDMAASRPV